MLYGSKIIMIIKVSNMENWKTNSSRPLLGKIKKKTGWNYEVVSKNVENKSKCYSYLMNWVEFSQKPI